MILTLAVNELKTIIKNTTNNVIDNHNDTHHIK